MTNREPVNPDDPALTAYALGEMTLSERVEFEVRLEASPRAKAELESMDDVMTLLSRGLKEEWRREMNEPFLEVLPSLSANEVVVTGRFRRSRKIALAAAAAVAVLLVATGTLVSIRGSGGDEGAPVAAALPGAAEGGEKIAEFVMLEETGIPVPRLFLTEELGTPASIDLAEALERVDELSFPVDATYLEAREVVSAADDGARSLASLPVAFDRIPGLERVDSYLPPVNREVPGGDQRLIERRDENSVYFAGGASPAGNQPAGSRVFVRGYVAMDGMAPAKEADSQGAGLAGFRPVSMSGNPVKQPEVDLKLLSNFQSIQKELSVIASSLPEDAESRQRLQNLVERNRQALSELKREFAR